MKKISILLLLFSVATLPTHAQWQDLFNGKDLSGWNQVNGKAKYEVKHGEVIGTATPNTPNSFLRTDKTYTDFILEVEVKVDSPLNSGIQIRSNQKPKSENSRVFGYQVEIDPSDRRWSGGIYDEGRRGWLYSLARNPKSQRAFKNGKWNQYRIEAIGNTLRTWINGIPCANLVDGMTAEGFIALQVHSIHGPELEGKQVRWRNIRIATTGLQTLQWGMPEIPEFSRIPNTLTEREKREGWQLLWDGKSTSGWRGAKLDHFPKKGWEVKEGVLSVLPSGGGESEHGGDIVTTEKYSNFELELDFMITKGANSGIKYFVDTELNQGKGSSIGLEFQILDDENHPDAKKGIAGNRTVGSLYDLITATNLSEPSRTDKRGVSPDQWNHARIVVNGSHVEHWLNNIKVVEYERGTQMYRALVAYSKYSVWPGFGEAPSGHILLQDHGDKVSFRSVKIREL